MSFARAFGAQPALPRASIVAVETDLSRGLHAFTIVGLPDKAVEEARDRMASAIKNSGIDSPKSSNKKIVISLAPAALKKEGSAFDLPVALSYLIAAKEVSFDTTGKLFAGELALDGGVRPIRGALSIAVAAKEEGFRELFLPRENVDEAALVDDITIYPVSSLTDVLRHFSDDTYMIVPHLRAKPVRVRAEESVSLDDIRGQESAKRALVIAEAGRHNIALHGPPGTGKTMLARAASALLPPLSDSEVIEVTTIHSVAGALRAHALWFPPFRSPHHTASYASLIGGGAVPRPGEVTLAHRGILFLDEFPEFNRDVINALREPLEDAQVSVSRVRGAALFPANFMLIAALNPCPCGHLGSDRCACMPHTIERYRRKISGPIVDRIDMWIHVGDIPLETLTVKKDRTHTEVTNARHQIEIARERQRARFKKHPHATLNSDMKPQDLESLAGVSDEAEKTLVAAARTMKLSPRGYHRTIKLGRTIADLADSETIDATHMLEALQYRARERV